MKRKLFIVSFIIITLVLIGFNNVTSSELPNCNESSTSTTQKTTEYIGDDNVSDNCTLIINGKDITNGNYVRINHAKHYAEIPFTTVIQELGAKVEWKDDSKAVVKYDGRKYILNTNEGTLVEKWDKHKLNQIMPAGGQQHKVVCKVVDNELIVDSNSSRYFIFVVMGANMKVDYNKNAVNIESNNTGDGSLC